MKKKIRTFVIGDIHGGYKALVQCLDRSKFDFEKDRLISLGDVADGWPEVAECFEELMEIKNLVMVRGNHDNWLLDYLRFEETPDIWITQGGRNSFASYQKNSELKEKHRDFLMKTPYSYVDEKNRLFVHGGLNRKFPIGEQSAEDLMWNRDLWYESEHYSSAGDPVFVTEFDTVFVGHTSIWKTSQVPLKSGNVWFLDSGGGWEGKLSLMNVDTEEVFQSDLLEELYPKGHN
ncbi:MAG: metallophosphoesterase [bacterium]|nr:metallophosphoesterase [bacterium]